MFCAFPLFLETEVDLTKSTASPQTLVFWPHFPPEVGLLKTEPLGRCRSARNPLVYQWEGGLIRRWELVGVVGCCLEINKCQKGWMDHDDHDDIVCMFHVFLIMYPTAVFVCSLHCMKPTFDCVGGDGYMLGSCVWCFDGSLHETSPTNHKAQVTGIRFNVWASAISMAAWSAWLPRGVHGNGPLECDPKSHLEFV